VFGDSPLTAWLTSMYPLVLTLATVRAVLSSVVEPSAQYWNQ
jgi:hypothetical protein